jgi:endo-1,4-beta-xylanase
MSQSAVSRRALMMQGAGAFAAHRLLAEPLNFVAPFMTGGSLNAAAARIGIAYGTAVNITSLRNDSAYGAAIARECGILVAENEMKMEYVEPSIGKVSFSGGDEIRAFARHHSMRLRGTTLVWHLGMPAWAGARINSREAEAFMNRWITLVAGRYKGEIESWDVVNEVIEPKAGRPDGLRPTLWLKALGPRYIDLAFHMLRDVDPTAAGLWNEDDVDLGAEWMETRRTVVLRTLEGLLARGVPIRRFGMQSHLNSLIALDPTRLRRFLAEIAGMGIAIEITELDVDDRAFPPDIRARDIGVADCARRFLDVVLDEPSVLNVLTWDIVDSNTWLNTSTERRRRDGLSQRSLPLDERYNRKPLWAALRQAFIDAPDHAVARQRLRSDYVGVMLIS